MANNQALATLTQEVVLACWDDREVAEAAKALTAYQSRERLGKLEEAAGLAAITLQSMWEGEGCPWGTVSTRLRRIDKSLDAIEDWMNANLESWQ